MANQFDTREETSEHRWVMPGTKILFPRYEESTYNLTFGAI